ncbi:MAG: hypothetical protein WC576_02440 [Candidatus Omnitrophota bacterium]|jgi:hypothetical protein
MENAVTLISALISLGLTIWFVIFTVLVLNKLEKIKDALSKNKEANTLT